jgi:hypothetical protein
MFTVSRKSIVFEIILLSVTAAFGQSKPVPAPDVDTPNAIHVWEKQEIVLTAHNNYDKPYTQVDVWVDLQGPGFSKRCYGFWDGANLFKVRIVATAAGEWSWTSGSNQKDAGLNGQTGSFKAVEWDEKAKEQNPLRRGMLVATDNGHAIEHPDGTPFFILGDTWWSAATFRYPWYDDDKQRPIGPDAGFKDYVRFRKQQGFNCIAMIAGFPNWATDDKPARIWIDPKKNLGVRAAWINQDPDNIALGPMAKAKDMYNEGGRPFMFPGKVPGYENNYPDMDRINPEYFKYMDRKIDYLNANGFVPFIEVSRRDASSAWAAYYKWPDSYSRYIQYIWARYQANVCIYSPIHYDWKDMAVVPDQFNEAANLVIDTFGRPPFGTLVSCNSSPSSLINFGSADKARWLTFHQTGNWREHEFYGLLTEIYNADPPRPALNGEPYYSGYNDKTRVDYKYGAKGGTETDDLYVRSGMYGSFISGGFAGHIYGCEALWGADIAPGSDPYMWDAFKWNSATQMKHLKKFALSQGNLYQQLVPKTELIEPNKEGKPKSYVGWAYCARTPDKKFFMLYFEKDCPRTVLRGALLGGEYQAKWYDTRNGSWSNAGVAGTLKADSSGRITISGYPSDNDWALSLLLK